MPLRDITCLHADDPRWDTDRRGPRGDVTKDHRVGSDARTIADFDVSENSGTGTQEYAITETGPPRSAAHTDGHDMDHSEVVADPLGHDRRPDRVGDVETTADLCSRDQLQTESAEDQTLDHSNGAWDAVIGCPAAEPQ
jgi:hypothetical protein